MFFKTIQKTEKSIECLSCMNRFHAVSACTMSFNSNIDNNTIDLCQNCLAESLPFQTLNDLEYEFTVLKGNNVRKDEMDRIKAFEIQPFRHK
jgi:hypothetical protein